MKQCQDIKNLKQGGLDNWHKNAALTKIWDLSNSLKNKKGFYSNEPIPFAPYLSISAIIIYFFKTLLNSKINLFFI